MSGLSVSAIGKSYGRVPVLQDISLDVPRGEFHTLLGPSGSGKTTLLKVIAGFTPSDHGQVVLGSEDMTHRPPEHRNIGVVFQNYALFPHMTVAQNVAFGLKMRGVARAERAARVADTLRLVRMSGFEQRKPNALSGGQQQRVALARALVIRPALLLLDEPLSALDRKVRQEVREELKRIQAETHVTTVMVTHDQEEALYLADRVVVLEGGVIRQQGAPATIYRHPADDFVAGFLGKINLLPVTVEARGLRLGERMIPLPAIDEPPAAGPAHFAIRPEEVSVLPEGMPRHPDELEGRLIGAEFGGPVVTLKVVLEGYEITVLALSPDVMDRELTQPDMRVRLLMRGGQLRPTTGSRA